VTARGPLVLVVIDGYGIAPPGPGNAVHLARTPHLDALASEASGTSITASGLPVGLPEGQQGNSEVGHLNLGAGRRVPQMLVRIDEAIAQLVSDPRLQAARDGRRTTLHLLGPVARAGARQSAPRLALIRIAQGRAWADRRAASPTGATRAGRRARGGDRWRPPGPA
jgi:2,3-bisphosphoglycerate-independent phosphoglycerate mutase